MTFTATTNLSLPIITTGTESGTWGDLVDNGLTSYLDIAIAGGLSVNITTADVTLTNTVGSSTSTNLSSTSAQYAILNITGAKNAAHNLILPGISKVYIINNAGTGNFALTIKAASTSGITLVDGEKAVIIWSGTDYVKIASSVITSATGTLTVPSGGTGLNALTANYVPYGNGTSAFNSSSQFQYNGNYLLVGAASALGGLTNPVAAFTGNPGATNYVQAYIYNAQNGISSSGDFVAYASNSTDAHGWADLGFTGPSYADPTYTVTGPNEAYVFGSALNSSYTGNVVYATDSTGSANAHQWYVGGFTQAKSAWKMQLTPTGLQLANALGGAYGGTGLTSPGTAGNVLTSDGTNWTSATSLTKQIQSISASVASNALTISASALTLDFRSTTLGSGTVTTVSGTPSNLVVPSGATLGSVNASLILPTGPTSRLIVLALNNAGTIELGVVNLAGGVNLTETGVISTTAISSGATSASVVYSTTARTNVSYRVIGYIESTQTTAGTWATTPSTIQGTGGEAVNDMSSLGYGQTWQDVTTSRTLGTTYTNSTGKPIMVSVCYQTGNCVIVVGGITISDTSAANNNTKTQNSFVVPPSTTYVVTAGSLTVWAELR